MQIAFRFRLQAVLETVGGRPSTTSQTKGGATVVTLRGRFVNDVVMWTLRRGTTDCECRATVADLLPGTYRPIA